MKSRFTRACVGVALAGLAVSMGSASEEASGENCSFTLNREEHLEREMRARRAVFERVLRFGRMSTSGPQRRAVPASEIPRHNFIDDEIFGKLQQAGVPSAPLATDAEFLRRVYLDLTGRLPSPAQVREFIQNENASKRRDVIDRLLYSPEFVERWTMWWGDLVQNNVTAQNLNQQIDGRNSMDKWIRVSLAGEKSARDMAWELVSGAGNTYDVGSANFAAKFVMGGGPAQDRYDNALARSVTAFLGMGHYDCVLCHDGRRHLDALSVWGKSATRMEAWRMAAHFARVDVRGRGNTSDFYRNSFDVVDRTTGTYDLNTNFGNRPNRARVGTMVNLTPEYRFGQAPRAGTNWREAFATQMVADPMFARNFVNRLWKQLFNLALVDPVDTLDPARLDPDSPPSDGWTLQATHPRLLEELAKRFEGNYFSLRETLRLMLESSAYQLSSRYDGDWSPGIVSLFARHYPRRLEGEEVHDALAHATGVFVNYTIQGWDDQVRWAVMLPDPSEPRNNGTAAGFMNVFIRGNRDTQQRSQSGSVLQQLALMNSTWVLDKIRVTASANLRDIGRLANREAVEEMWLRFLARMPEDAERQKGEALLAKAATAAARNAALEDLAWGLVNKIEFLFSY